MPGFSPALAAIVDALSLLQRLHRARNHVSVATTISTLLEATRAHVRFALEHGGEQVLANVLHVAELARRYEADGGISFRGFIEELREQAEDGQAGEAPILEEGSDGVRLMTVHKAKGLEFPVVILADMTAKIRSASASRYIDSERGACAIRIAGCSPFDLIQHEPEELARDGAEGVRLAYVAATRARDLLVVPAVGDEAREGWIDPINRAIYPPDETRRAAGRCAGMSCVQIEGLGSDASQRRSRLDEYRCSGPARVRRQSLGRLVGSAQPRAQGRAAARDSPFRAHRQGCGAADCRGRSRRLHRVADTHRRCRGERRTPIDCGADRDAVVEGSRRMTASVKLPPVKIVEVPREADRPTGIRFGALVHAVLGTVPLDGDADVIRRVTELQARTLGSTDEEVESAAKVVQTVLALPILERAREAAKAHRCRREAPIAWRHGETLIEGVIDLAFEEGERWTIVDFKTDEEFRSAAPYQRQVGLYALAVEKACSAPVAAFLVKI